MHAIKGLEKFSFGPDSHEHEENECYITDARFERIADEIGVQPEDYPELEQMIRQGIDGPSIGD